MCIRDRNGIDQQNQEEAGDRSQEGAEERNDIGDAHKNGHQRRVGHIQDGTADKAQDSDDKGIQQLAPDKTGENMVCLVGTPEDPVDPVSRKEAVGNLCLLYTSSAPP